MFALLGRMRGGGVGRGGKGGVGGLLVQVGAGIRASGQRGGDGLKETHGRVCGVGRMMLRGEEGR